MKTISLKSRLVTTLSILILFFFIQALVTWYFVNQANKDRAFAGSDLQQIDKWIAAANV